MKSTATCDSDPSSSILDVVFGMIGDCSSLADALEEAEQADWILSVEDDDDVAFVLQWRLKEQGINVVRAKEGREGYRRAFINNPRAIILDYELPNGNGDYVIRRLKESPATRDIPVIVLTGRHEVEVERQMMRLGAHAFLRKPNYWTELQRVLEAIA